MTGISLKVFTSWSELQAVKNGTSTMLVAYTENNAPVAAIYEISVPLDVCECVGKEVRVNVSQIQQTATELAETMGKPLGVEIVKALSQLS